MEVVKKQKSGGARERLISASMTVEAALVLPVFLFAVTAFLYLFQLIFLQQGIQSALNQTAEYFAKNAYLYEKMADEFSDISNDEILAFCDALDVENAVSSFIYEEKFRDYTKDSILQATVIAGGSDGISIQCQADYFEEGEVDVCAYYTCRIPVLFFPLDDLECIQRSKAKNWTGRDAVCRYAQDSEQETAKEQEVYMTDTGTRYHTHQDCTHLKLSVKSTTYGKVPYLRNKNNCKYYACELCAKNTNFGPESIVYITDEGRCYHTSKNCSGIIRRVTSYKITDIPAGTPCCKRCQKRDEQEVEP